MLLKLLAWAPKSLVSDFNGINLPSAYESRSSDIHSCSRIATAQMTSTNLWSIRNCMCEITLYVKQLCNLLLWSPPNINQFLVIFYLEVKQKYQEDLMTWEELQQLHYNKLSGETLCLVLYLFKRAQIVKVLCLTLFSASKTTVIYRMLQY